MQAQTVPLLVAVSENSAVHTAASGRQTDVALPLSWRDGAAKARRGSGVTVGPPVSTHRKTKRLFSITQVTFTRPAGVERDSYLVALVASSCNPSGRPVG